MKTTIKNRNIKYVGEKRKILSKNKINEKL